MASLPWAYYSFPVYLFVYVSLSLFLQDAWIPTALYQSTLQVRIKGTSCTRDVSTNWQEFPESYQLPLDSRPICLPASCLSQALWTTSFCVEILLQSGFMVKADNCYLQVPTHSWFLSYIPVSHPVPRLNFILSHWSVGLIHPSTYYNNHSCNHPPSMLSSPWLSSQTQLSVRRHENPMLSVMLSSWLDILIRYQCSWERSQRPYRKLSSFDFYSYVCARAYTCVLACIHISLCVLGTGHVPSLLQEYSRDFLDRSDSSHMYALYQSLDITRPQDQTTTLSESFPA